MGAQPAMEVIARENAVTVIDHLTRQRTVTEESDPMEVLAPIATCIQWHNADKMIHIGSRSAV